MCVSNTAMNALLTKCPTCARDKGVPCIRLALAPGGRTVWTQSEPHPARVEKTRV